MAQDRNNYSGSHTVIYTELFPMTFSDLEHQMQHITQPSQQQFHRRSCSRTV